MNDHEHTEGAGAGWSRRQFLERMGGAGAGLALGLAIPPSLSLGTPFPSTDQFGAGIAVNWFDLALRLVRTTPGFTPPVASRALGYTGLTLYESVVPGMPGYRSLVGALPGLGRMPGGTTAQHWPMVANAALAAVLRALFPTTSAENLRSIDALEARMARGLGSSVPRGVQQRAIRRGQTVAAIVFEWSKSGGGHEGYLHNFPSDYVPPVGDAYWVPTPEGFLSALQPYWGSNRTFAVSSGAACPPGDHTPFSADPSSAFYAEAMETYLAVNNLSPEQEAIALFWSDDPGTTATPPGHSVAIASQVLRKEKATLTTAAETYAKVGMAVADAFVCCWHTKYVYNLLRPVTYIQRYIDGGWLPLLNTPPFPEYTSGHSVQSGAAFQVLTDLFGDGYRFVDHTHDARGLAPRSFGSFFEAAEEAAISRLYGGIHYRPAIDLGVDQGVCIGQTVSAMPFRG